MAYNFAVVGPFEVPCIANGGRKILKKATDIKEELRDKEGAEFLDGPGCYVYACSAGRGSVPLYVGKATKHILSEALNPRNLLNINHFLFTRQRGTIQLFGIYQTNQAKAKRDEAISEMEEFLIGFAARRNKDLINIHNTGEDDWSIAGVVNQGQGAATIPARAFKAMMGMRSKSAPTIRNEAAATAAEPEVKTVDVESAIEDPKEVEEVQEAAAGTSLSLSTSELLAHRGQQGATK